MTLPRSLAAVAVATVSSLFFATPAIVSAQGSPDPAAGPVEPPDDVGPKPAALSVKVKGLRGGRRPALSRTTVAGDVRPFVPGQIVRVRFHRAGKVVKTKHVSVRRAPNGGRGVFKATSPRLLKPGRYRARVKKPGTAGQVRARAATEAFGLRYPSLRQGDHGRAVALLTRLLRKQGYYAPNDRHFREETASAVLAFRKVNGMATTKRAGPEILERLIRGRGGYELRRPGAGRHVEVNTTRQVLVLASGGEVRHTFHISSGKQTTPSDHGHFRFYRRHAGYNNVGMLHSIYYNRGEAVHGYATVPSYPASHGCVRVPIHSARFVYEWVRLGMSIYVH